MKFSSKPGPALPVTVANGGTGVATLGDAGVLIGNGTGAIQVTGAGTSGQVLTSNGAGVDPTFQAAAAGTPTMKFAIAFEGSGRFESTVVGSGVTTFDTFGVDLDTSTTSGSSAVIRCNISRQPGGGVLFAGSPIFTVHLDMVALVAASGAGSSFFGIGLVTVGGTGHTFTENHIGFKILKSAGTVSLYATQADGTTENASAALTTLVDADSADLIADVNGTTSVDYYWRKNGGALSSATNLTTNLPTANERRVAYSISNNSTAFQFRMEVNCSSYER